MYLFVRKDASGHPNGSYLLDDIVFGGLSPPFSLTASAQTHRRNGCNTWLFDPSKQCSNTLFSFIRAGMAAMLGPGLREMVPNSMGDPECWRRNAGVHG